MGWFVSVGVRGERGCGYGFVIVSGYRIQLGAKKCQMGWECLSAWVSVLVFFLFLLYFILNFSFSYNKAKTYTIYSK